ncbi:MAG: SDR family oxidoreductase [Pseudomonadales bacterium]|nr:SDR family oxidoreductase [Pseudomonadales bacterium]
MPTILITGANRGIGLELARQYAKADWRVIATARAVAPATELASVAQQHSNLSIDPLDVTDNDAIAALSKKHREPLDVLLNNAGWLGDPRKQGLGELDAKVFETVMRTNAYAPLAMARAFLPQIEASAQKNIVVLTSGLSSLANTRNFGNLYFYRMSKAAANMAMRALQADLRAKGIEVGILAPGIVDTRLLRQSGWTGEALDPETSAAGVIRNIARLKGQDPQIHLYSGDAVPW